MEMKDNFNGFYRPTEREFKKMWSESYFVFDTNVLINPFRFQETAREVIFEILEKLCKSDRIWIPHQVGLEYHHNVDEEIYKQEKSYEDLKTSITKLGTDLENEYKRISLKHSTLILNDAIQKKFNDVLEELTQEVDKQKKEHPDCEKLKLRIARIFKGKVGAPYTQEQLDELYNEGEKRYEHSVPPGFRDESRKGESKRYFDGIFYTKKYGDLVLWKQIIDFAKDKETDVIFVTDDEKADWWSISHGKTVGPHPELLQEFKRETEGKNIYIYKTKQFLEQCKDFERLNIDHKRIDIAVESINQYKMSVKANEVVINEKLEGEKFESYKNLNHVLNLLDDKSLDDISNIYRKSFFDELVDKKETMYKYSIIALLDNRDLDDFEISVRMVYRLLYEDKSLSITKVKLTKLSSNSKLLSMIVSSSQKINTEIFTKRLQMLLSPDSEITEMKEV